jgi:cystathionine gamma-synthase
MMTKSKVTNWSHVGPGTASVWAGEDTLDARDGTQPPIVTSVTFGFEDLAQWLEVARGDQAGHLYSRSSNPTVQVLEKKIRCLEGAEAAIAFATGMAAVSETLHALLSPGDRVVTIADSYGGTSKIFLEILPRWGVDVEICETTDHAALEAAILRGCRAVYLESPTNPTLKVVDLRRLAEAGHDVGATVIVDNTFATPINQRPLALGADLVVHSATKFLGGHSDAMGGLLCGRPELIEQVFARREVTGAALDAMSAYLLIRGIKTLELRVERHNSNAMAIARFLSGHPKISSVFYPGLEGHPDFAIARQQMRGFGGVLSFTLDGSHPEVGRFLSGLRFAHLAASLGSVGTLVGPPSTTSHVELSAAQRATLGIPESLIRYSVGIENPDDLITDLETALAAV